MGTTFLVSSGDNGVVGNHPEGVCSDTGFGNNLTDTLGTFLPIFPASCPYVTAVGASTVSPGNSVRENMLRE